MSLKKSLILISLLFFVLGFSASVAAQGEGSLLDGYEDHGYGEDDQDYTEEESSSDDSSEDDQSDLDGFEDHGYGGEDTSDTSDETTEHGEGDLLDGYEDHGYGEDDQDYQEHSEEPRLEDYEDHGYGEGEDSLLDGYEDHGYGEGEDSLLDGYEDHGYGEGEDSLLDGYEDHGWGSDNEEEQTDDTTTTTTTGGGGGGGGGSDPGDPDPDPANFEVSITDPSNQEQFEIGSEVEVSYSVENTGDESDTQDIELFIGDSSSSESSDGVQLGGGDTATGELDWDTTGLDEGNYELEVTSNDDSDSVEVTLVEDLDDTYSLDVSIDGEGSTTPAEGSHNYQEGEVVEVSASPDSGWEFVEWTGDIQSTSSTVDVTIDSNKQVTANFEEDDSDDGSGSTGSSTSTAPSFSIGTQDMTLELSHETIVVGGSVQASGYVDNARAGRTVSIEIDDTEVARTETASDGYYETNFVPEEVGTKTVTAASNRAEASAELEVTPSVEITSLTHPETVEVDESFQICAEADSQVEPEFRLFEDGASVASDSGSGEICFDRTLSETGTYDYELVASAGSNQDSRTFSIEATQQTDGGTGTPPQQGLTGAFLESMSGTWARLLISIIVGAIITVLALSIEI